MESKICTTCGVEKNIEMFVSHLDLKRGKRYYRSKCKECKNLLAKLNRVSKPSKRIRWTYEMIKQESSKYHHKIDFIKNSPSAYNAARKRNIVEEVCSHMEPLGDSYRRIVYSYEFADNYVYVGLTSNKNRRHLQHMNDKKGPVYNHRNKTNLIPVHKIISNGYISHKQAQKLEKETIENYRKYGWLLLNSTAPGGLGGHTLKWTEDSLREEALKYKTRKEMSEKSGKAYSTIRKRNLLHLLSHMDWILNPNRSIEECINTAKKYTTLRDFKKENAKLYWWINSRKLVSISKKYETIKDFYENDLKAYRYLVERDDFYELTKHLKRLR